MESRKEKEALFHDIKGKDFLTMTEEEYQKKYPSAKFYSVTNASEIYVDKVISKLKGKKVLDYCCGKGKLSIKMARMGAEVVGIDISEESINAAVLAAKEANMSERCNFIIGDAEKTPFEDESFDAIVFSGVLHHLDLENAFKELARLVKKNGMILGIEALAHNPVFMWYRRKTPELRTEWEINHILTVSNIEMGLKYFDRLTIRYFHLLVLLAVPFEKTCVFKALRALLNGIDAIILSLPGIQRLAWQGIFIYRKKK